MKHGEATCARDCSRYDSGGDIGGRCVVRLLGMVELTWRNFVV